jgi:uncharacterized repeat protein (TIGR03803 family)
VSVTPQIAAPYSGAGPATRSLEPMLARQPPTGAGYKTLHSFSGGKDGSHPVASLIAVGSELYGTTETGGASNTGTVFSVSKTGANYRVLHSFGSGTDGAEPVAGLIAVGSELYGTTELGGTDGEGTVFKISESGTERVLYSFTGGEKGGSSTDGAEPEAGLIAVGSELYGTTFAGGAYFYGGGTVFEVSTSGKESVLHSFCSQSSCTDGQSPAAGLIAVGSELYGTTQSGGATGQGTVFEVNTSGKERVLHSFCSRSGCPDGDGPLGGLIAVGNALVGTTQGGGTYYNGTYGTIFEVSKSGKERVLHSFDFSDGAAPYAGLTGVGSELYVTTGLFGAYAGEDGTVFSVSSTGMKFRVLHSFGTGRSTDGANPRAGLIAVGSDLYGTTNFGGGKGCSSYGDGCGTVFEVTP